MSVEMIDLTVSIVNHNNYKLLYKCLDSIYNSFLSAYKIEIIIIDNFSNNGSIKTIKKKYPQIIIIENNERFGFAYNHNQALRIAQGRFVLLLNDDTIINEGTIDKSIEFIKNHKNVGIMGCKVYFPNKKLQYTCGRFPKYFGEIFRLTIGLVVPIQLGYNKLKYMYDFNYTEVKEVNWVSGVFFLIRKNLIEQIGYLDENFYMYYEDVEYCLRMQNKTTFKVFFNPDIVITHYQGMSNYPNSYWSLAQNVLSASYYFGKQYGKTASLLFYYSCLTFYLISYPFIYLLNLFTIKKIKQIRRREFMLKDLIKKLL